LTVKRAIEKRKAEAALQKAYADLEREVEKRTAELKKANEKLQTEVAERKKAEEESRKLAEEWETTFNSISDMAVIIDKNYELTQINRTCSNAFKMSPKELIGMKCYEVFHGAKAPPNDCLFNQAIKSKIPVIREFFEPHLGIYLEEIISPIVEKGRVIGAIHIAKDISIRKRTEEQLINSERMVGVGELAAGIAHEIRNPLSNISASAQLCLSKQMHHMQFKKHMRLILRNSQAANKIIQDLLNFAQPREMVFKPDNIRTVINYVCSLVKARCIKQHVVLRKRVSRRIPEIIMDENRLKQVFLNFVINSLDSMETGGRLFINAYSEEKEIVVRFFDTGIGIPAENLDNIFDPFFTSKKDGVGLGLSLARQIIGIHNGRIEARSTPDQGTEITVRLPIQGSS
jgi:PAS domain S-box-containing protein